MARKTRPLSGQSQRKYFRDLFQADPGVTRDAVTRLTDICTDELAHIQVRTEKMTVRIAMAVLTKRAAGTGSTQAPTTPPEAGSAVTAPDFDPHAFSLIVVMTKEGKDGLLKRLRAIESVDKLRAIAKAQHVGVDPDLDDPMIVCAAIIAGTEKRIAHRKAAAS
jgi:hypothetical protein